MQAYQPARAKSRPTDWVYYNEINEYAAQWLKNLIAAGKLPAGDVDTRSIEDVQPDDLIVYTQCHFFAGIGGWPLALKIAGWPKGKEVWTGSCPCQPFSVAGKQEGFDDERDLWPAWFRLVEKRRPTTVMGEQVASAIEWRTRMHSDMERIGYAIGSKPIQAASAGACQLRDRLWFMASQPGIAERESQHQGMSESRERSRIDCSRSGPGCDSTVVLAGNDIQRQGDGRLQRSGQLSGTGGDTQDCSVVLASQRQRRPRLEESTSQPGDHRSQLAATERDRPVGLVSPTSNGWGEGWTESEFRSRGFTAAVASLSDGQGGTWQFIECPDGKYRRLPPPRVRWLGNGIPGRVEQLRAFGNAIYVPLAVQVIKAYMESTNVCFE